MNKKSKKSKKLTLSIETLKNLSEPQSKEVVGGATRILCTGTHACSGCQPCA